MRMHAGSIGLMVKESRDESQAAPTGVSPVKCSPVRLPRQLRDHRSGVCSVRSDFIGPCTRCHLSLSLN